MRRKIKFFWQRLTRGFDDSETWSLDYTFFRWLLPRLKRFREVICCYPCRFNSLEEWQAELDKAIADLEVLQEDGGCSKEYDEAYKRFMDWFCSRLGNLWW
jgi:hypothetical protein